MSGKKSYTKPLIVVEEYETTEFAKNCDGDGHLFKTVGKNRCVDYSGPNVGEWDCWWTDRVSAEMNPVVMAVDNLATSSNASLVLNDGSNGEISTMGLLYCHDVNYAVVWCRHSQETNPGMNPTMTS